MKAVTVYMLQTLTKCIYNSHLNTVPLVPTLIITAALPPFDCEQSCERVQATPPLFEEIGTEQRSAR